METKATVFDVAKYVLSKTGSITAMKLQKLVYYAQVWSLVWDEKPLFSEQFEAWAHGPVIPALYQAHKGLFKVSAKNISGKISALTANQKDTIDRVLAVYGKLTAQQLIDLTHWEAPWRNARGNMPAGTPCQNEISQTDIFEYYASLPVRESR